MAEVPDELIRLERLAEEERAKLAGLTGDDYDAQLRRWREASDTVQEAITSYAEATEAGRGQLEQAVRKAVQRTQEDPAVE
ncbi:hypothetical protein [Streptomyces sp. NPDC127190]|uniref:hypothetical protein n=1 Tax=unclassified Streptomyces TaxID=2593676 RepID=UPI00363006A9